MVPAEPLTDRQTRKKQVQRRLDEPAVQLLTQAYLEGLGVAELAARFRVHRNTVAQHLARAGIERRKRPVLGGRLDEVLALREQGHSYYRISRDLGVPESTIATAIMRIEGP